MKATILLVLAVICLASTLANSQAKPDYYLLEAMNSHKCAHVQAARQDNGARISQWDCRDQKQLDFPQYFQWQKINVGGRVLSASSET